MIRYHFTYAGVELNLPQIELRFRHKEPAERILRQQLYHNVQMLASDMIGLLEFVRHRHRKNIAQIVHPVVTSLFHLEILK